MRQSLIQKAKRLILNPPVFPDDFRKTQISQAVVIVSNSLLLVLILAVIATIFFFASKVLSALMIAFLFIILITVRISLHFGLVQLSAMLFVFPIWVCVTLTVALSGGIHSSDILLQVAVVIITPVFLDLKWTLILAVLTFIADSLMTFYELFVGQLPQLMPQPTLARLVLLLIALIICLAPQGALLLSLRRTLAQLNQSQRHYATLFNHAPVMCVVLRHSNSDMIIANCNQEFANTIGKPVETIRGLELGIFYDDRSNKDLARSILEEDDSIFHSPKERTLLTTDGRRIETLATAAPINDNDDPSIASIIMYLDISERYELDQHRQELLQEREALLHELQHRSINNMQIMSSLISIYEDEDYSEGSAKKYRAMRNRIEAMSLAMRQLYDSDDLASIEFSSYTLDLVAFCIGGIPINRKLPVFEYDFTEVRASLDIALPYGLVLMELVGNALEFAFPNRGSNNRVIIQLSRPQPDRVRLIVKDNGIGFPPAFNPRRDSSIGLRNALLIAEEQLQGSLSFSISQGLCCQFEFPLYPEPF